jgi:hypothetical protein
VNNITLRPISAALLPKSFSRATSDSFEEDIPTIYHEVELDVMVETSTKTIPHPVPGSGLYDSEHVGGSEKTAAPSVPREKENSGVSFGDAKRTRQFNLAVLGGMSSVPSRLESSSVQRVQREKRHSLASLIFLSFYFVMVCHSPS